MKFKIKILICMIVLLIITVSCKKQSNVHEYVYNGIYHWNINNENNKSEHVFTNNVCTECGLYYNKAFFDIFGDEAVIYTSNNNPYHVDIKKYGDSVSAFFYSPNIEANDDIYIDIDKKKFYSDNYSISYTYEDSFYRTKHGLLSGNKEPLEYLPNSNPFKMGESEIRLSDALYVLDEKGNFLGYFTNSLNDESRPIWKCGAYVTHDDVAAYVLAFGEVPANSDYIPSKKGERRKSIDTWGEYARLNKSYYLNDYKKFKYEPILPKSKYIETDFGSDKEYYSGGQRQVPYAKGQKIVRGVCRFIFTDIAYESKIEDRHVFFTYNHYNDFQEYLNYDGGYGKRFGNESAGNPFCRSPYVYTETYIPPTKFTEAIIQSIKDIKLK